MDGFGIALLAATFLTSLVAGLLFAFTVVVMPGFATLPDREYLAAFRAIDRVVQDNQPAFMVAWVGSVVALLATAVLALNGADSGDRMLVAVALAVDLVGVQGITAGVNIPMNNRVQALDLDALDETAIRQARVDFEPRWTRANLVRTVLAGLVVVLLLLARA